MIFILIANFMNCYCETSKADYSKELENLENSRSGVIEIYIGFESDGFHMIKHVCGTVVQNDKSTYILTLYKETSVSDDELKKYCTENEINKANKDDVAAYAVADDKLIKISLKDSDKTADIALYKTSEKIDSKIVIPIADDSNVSKDTKVYSIGFPAKMKENTETDFYAKNTVIYSGTLTKDYNGASDTTLTYNSLVDSGTMGCPITNEKGELLGINSSFSRGQDILEYTVVSSFKIKEFLDKNKITYANEPLTEKVAETKSGNSVYKIGKTYSLPITGIIVLLLIVLMLLTRKREE